MKTNDACEAECNFESCNYGNYYRCFPVPKDNLTDWLKLTELSLFIIGDNAYIDPKDEYEKINMLNILKPQIDGDDGDSDDYEEEERVDT